MSPALKGFESSLFRVLRLRTTATTSEAASQAEQALTLARVNLQPEEPDLLPWLTPPEEYEIHQAAQEAEEPFVRLKQQFLWFDLERDPDANLLRAALREMSGEALKACLATDTRLPDESAEPGPASTPQIAHAVNQANVRLLAAACEGWLSRQTMRPLEPRPIPRNRWQTIGPFRSLALPHNLMDGAADSGSTAESLWEQGLRKWSAVLSHPLFAAYLAECIGDLQDDFIGVEDIETIEESLRTHFADISAQQARFFLQMGDYPRTALLVAAMQRSGMELRILAPALRPLRQVFQAELSELDSLIEEPGNDQTCVHAYLDRLQKIRDRWLIIDSGGVVGLRDLLDSAVEKSYLRIRRLESGVKIAAPLLAKMKNIISANSLKERISGFEKELEQVRTRVCHFCGGLPDYDRSVVLSGKKETGRTRNFNSTTVHYALRSAIVLRCARCAKFHKYLRRVGFWLSLCTLPGIAAILVSILGQN